jgi:hypothetical protein
MGIQDAMRPKAKRGERSERGRKGGEVEVEESEKRLGEVRVGGEG